MKFYATDLALMVKDVETEVEVKCNMVRRGVRPAWDTTIQKMHGLRDILYEEEHEFDDVLVMRLIKAAGTASAFTRFREADDYMIYDLRGWLEDR